MNGIPGDASTGELQLIGKHEWDFEEQSNESATSAGLNPSAG